MPAEIVMRHRLPHFQHLFSGGGYAAAYYSYMWSEVLDADAFEAFEETGDAFDPATAKRLREFIYGAGNLRDPAEAYKAFRGRLPAVDALLKKRGRSRDAPCTGHDPAHRRPPPRRRLRAASRRRRGRPRHSRPKAATPSRRCSPWRRSIAAVYPHMNHIGGDGFWLIREPPAACARMMGAGRAGAKRRRSSIATPAMTKFRRAGRSPRSPCRARWPAGCSRARRRRRNWRRRRLPLDVLLAPPSSTRARATR